MKFLLIAIEIIALIAFATCPLFAQASTAALSGVVRDFTGGVVPGVSVTATHIESGLARTVDTNDSGDYKLFSLPVGPYELTASKLGFQQQVRRGINLAVGQEAVVNLTLELGSVEQRMIVTAETPLVNTTLSSTSGLITEAQIKDLPLNGRSFEQLLTLNTGTVNNTAHSGGSSFSVAGKRTETNRFLINGVDYVGDNPTGQYIAPQGSSGYVLGVDAVREYNVLGHTYGAEYGKRAGGQISVVTTSGTNQWHGTVFEYMRNSALDARYFFSTTEGPPPFKRNQFGGSVGGPIIRDKMFAFGNYEGFRERLAVDTVAIVPSSQARQGRLPNASGIYVPVQNLVPGMLPFFRYWPEPNGEEVLVNGLPTGTAYYRGNPSRKLDEDFGLTRYDYNISKTDSLSSTFTLSKGTAVLPFLLFSGSGPQNLYTFGLQETHTFSPTTLNVSMFGYSHARAEGQIRPVEPFPDNLLLMKGGNRNNPGSISIGGGAVETAGGSNLFFNQRRNFTAADDLRVVRGRHSWSMGVWFMRVQQTAFSSQPTSAGAVSYPTLLAFLQDQPNQFVALTNPTPLNFSSTEAAWYIQDEIKLRSNLTVRLGLRDEMTNGWNEKDGHAANYSFDRNGVILTNPYIGHSAFLKNNAKALWQPRVGVAWDPTGKAEWSVRAGFGIHNDLQDNLAHRLNANPPFNARITITGWPLLSFIPISSATPAAPSCSAESPLREPDCVIFAPGGLDPVMKTPTVQQWSLELERGITEDLKLQLSYVGSQSYHISTTMDMNTIQPQVCSNPQGCTSGGTRPANQRVVVPQGTEYVPPGTRPNPFVGSTQGWYYLGTSSYHAGNVTLLKRSPNGLTFKTNYTWSKVIDLNSAILGPSADNEPATVLNRFDLKRNRGIGSYSLKHQFNANFNYPLPFGSGQRFATGAGGLIDTLIGGWQWAGIVNAQSGFPFTPLIGFNQSGNGDMRNPDVPNRNPNFKGPVILGTDGFRKTGRYFDPNAFSLPPAGTFGNVARGSLTGPGLYTVDTSLFKKFAVSEEWSLQLRAEAFNVFNHTNFNTPNPVVFLGNAISPSAGVITTTATRERQIQLALRLLF